MKKELDVINEAASRIMNEQDDDDDAKIEALGNIEVALDQLSDSTLWTELEQELEMIRKGVIQLRDYDVRNQRELEFRIVAALRALRTGVDTFEQARAFFKKSVE